MLPRVFIMYGYMLYSNGSHYCGASFDRKALVDAIVHGLTPGD